ncbi:MAG: hypothetical protein A2Y12_12270 [Planctomycetes bacterium GWF2_42_9]|nr:MAG: hypothetical protein A2Y12_12270 [Planctomycetes bacterium GWF2_42_9]
MPCKIRKNINWYIFAAVAQRKLAVTKISSPANKTGFRPNLSDSVPKMSRQTAKNAKKSTSDKLAVCVVIFQCFAIVGSAGRYISVAKGDVVDSRPK